MSDRNLKSPENTLSMGNRETLIGIVEDQIRQYLSQSGYEYLLLRGLKFQDSVEKVEANIDLLLVSPLGMMVIDVKNWLGSAQDVGQGMWRQSTENRNRISKNGFLASQEKLDSVLRYLHKNKLGCKLGIKKSVLVWVNDIKLDSMISQHSSSLTLKDLCNEVGLMFPKRVNSRRGREADAPVGVMAAEYFEKLEELFERRSRWDEIILVDGRVVRGKVTGTSGLPEESKILDRSRVKSVVMSTPSSFIGKIMGTKVTVTKNYSRKSSQKHETGFMKFNNSNLSIQPIGRDLELKLPLVKVKKINFGR